MLKNMKIGTRLMLSFGLVVLLLVGVAGTGYLGVTESEKTIVSILDSEAKIAEHSARVRSNIVGMRRYEKDMFLNIANTKQVEEYYAKWKEEEGKAADRVTDLEKVVHSKEDVEQVKTIKDNFLSYKTGFAKVATAIRDGKLKNAAEANAAVSAFKDESHKMEQTAILMAQESTKIMEQEKGVVEKASQHVVFLLITFSVVAILLVIALSFLVTSSIKKPLQVGVDTANRLAEGDLTFETRQTSKDETGQLLAAMSVMLNKLKEVVRR